MSAEGRIALLALVVVALIGLWMWDRDRLKAKIDELQTLADRPLWKILSRSEREWLCQQPLSDHERELLQRPADDPEREWLMRSWENTIGPAELRRREGFDQG